MKTKNLKKVIKTRVVGVICPNCNDFIYSRARHDYHTCTCKQTSVDGGFDYLRFGGKDIGLIKSKRKFINSTKQELYDDWNHQTNKFGIIHLN